MKIIKKPSETIQREAAHGGSGARRLYVSNTELETTAFQALTHGFLPANSQRFLDRLANHQYIGHLPCSGTPHR